MKAPIMPARTAIQSRVLAPAGRVADGMVVGMRETSSRLEASLDYSRPRDADPVRGGGVDAGLDRHARTKIARALALGVERDLHRNALHDFGEVARRVVGRQERESLAARRRHAVDMAVEDAARKHVHLDRRGLAALHVGELRFLVVRDHISRVGRDDRHELRAGLDELADAERAVADGSVDRGDDRRVAQIELGLMLGRLFVGERRARLRRLRLDHVELLLHRLKRAGVALDAGAGGRDLR